MRKPVTIFITLLLTAFLLAACGQLGDSPAAQDPEGIPTMVLTPTNTATPTPTLPATYTPIAMAHGGHLFITGGARSVHIVQPGDTLGNLAKQYGVTVQLIAQANRITNYNLIEVGDVLYIPPCD